MMTQSERCVSSSQRFLGALAASVPLSTLESGTITLQNDVTFIQGISSTAYCETLLRGGRTTHDLSRFCPLAPFRLESGDLDALVAPRR